MFNMLKQPFFFESELNGTLLNVPPYPTYNTIYIFFCAMP